MTVQKIISMSEVDLKGTAATTSAPKEDEDLSRFFKSKATQGL